MHQFEPKFLHFPYAVLIKKNYHPNLNLNKIRNIVPFNNTQDIYIAIYQLVKQWNSY